MSTGRLSCLIAEAFAARAETERIFYVCGEKAVRPSVENAEIFPVEGVAELAETLTGLAESQKIDAVIHAMAVSDYSVRAVSRVGAIAESFPRDGKIPSDVDDLVIFMQRTPKVISMLRGLLPEAVIVGFKLLDGVSEGQLVEVGRALLKKNDCDFVLANDLRNIDAAGHIGHLIDRSGAYVTYNNKEEIARGIAGAVICGRMG
jgi:phosphopantothenate-cysteine ligase